MSIITFTLAITFFVFSQTVGAQICNDPGICVDSFFLGSVSVNGTMDCLNACRLNEGCNFATYLSNCGPKDCINCLFFKTCEKLDSNTCPNCLTSSTDCPPPPQCNVTGICTVSYIKIRPHSCLTVDISHNFCRENFCILKL